MIHCQNKEEDDLPTLPTQEHKMDQINIVKDKEHKQERMTIGIHTPVVRDRQEREMQTRRHRKFGYAKCSRTARDLSELI